MIAINIISLDGNNTTFNAHEGITIKVLKEEYAESEGAELEEIYFEFMLGTRILNDDATLNELLGDDLYELNITSMRRLPLRANCFMEINSLDSSSNNPIEMLQRLSAILTTNISEEEGNPILASSDSEIILAAVKKNMLFLEYHVSEELKANYDFILAAVKQKGLALQYASEELRNDRNIVLAAVEQDVLAFQYASPELRNDSKILKKINPIPFEAFTRPLNAVERVQSSTSNSSSSTRNRQAYTTSKIISL